MKDEMLTPNSADLELILTQATEKELEPIVTAIEFLMDKSSTKGLSKSGDRQYILETPSLLSSAFVDLGRELHEGYVFKEDIGSYENILQQVINASDIKMLDKDDSRMTSCTEQLLFRQYLASYLKMQDKEGLPGFFSFLSKSMSDKEIDTFLSTENSEGKADYIFQLLSSDMLLEAINLIECPSSDYKNRAALDLDRISDWFFPTKMLFNTVSSWKEKSAIRERALLGLVMRVALIRKRLIDESRNNFICKLEKLV